MSKRRSKHSFSKEKKEMIKKMKKKLSLMGVPCDQWSVYTQKELRELQKSKDIHSSKFMNKITEGFGKVVGKVALRFF